MNQDKRKRIEQARTGPIKTSRHKGSLSQWDRTKHAADLIKIGLYPPEVADCRERLIRTFN